MADHPLTVTARASAPVLAWTACAVAWCLVLGAVHAESPWGGVTMVLGISATFEVARWATVVVPVAVPAAVIAGGLVVAVVGAARGDLLDLLEGPLGYANATAALATAVTAAALVLRVRVRSRAVRVASVVVALGAASVPVAVHSWLGVAAVAAVLVGALPAWRRRSPASLVGGAVVLVVATATTVAVAAAVAGPAARVLGASVPSLPVSITERVRLWRRALALLLEAPLVGVGRDGFVDGPPPAIAPWERYAHAEHLQLAATGGLVALALLVVALAWLLRTAAGTSGHTVTDAAVPIGLALLVGAGGHAATDYVGHASLVRLSVVAMLGTTLAVPRRPARLPGIPGAVEPAPVVNRR